MKATFSFLLALFLLGNTVSGFSNEPETFFTNSTSPPVFVSSNTQALIGVYELSGMGINSTSFASQAMDADGIHYDSDNDILYQLNRTDNVINAYRGICDSLEAGSTPAVTATSTSDFINGREIAVSGNKLVVAQDANNANGNLNKFFIYNITPSDITLERSFEVSVNLWGFRILGNTVFAVVDNSNQIAIFNGFFDYADGSLVDPTNIATVEGITRTHGITYVPAGDRMILTDIGDVDNDSDGALVYIDGFFASIGNDFLIDVNEQIRIEGTNSTLGNPVDVVFEEEGQRIFVAERANGGGKLLAFDLPSDNGDATPVYSHDFAGASAVTFVDENIPSVNLVSRFYASSNTSGDIGAYEILDNGILQFSTFDAGGEDAEGIHYDIENDVLYQLDRTNNVINLYGQVKASLDLNATPPLIATSTSDFINGREIVVSNGQLVVAQDANVDNGMQNRLVVYEVTDSSIIYDRGHDVNINLWGLTTSDQVLFAVVDNSNEVALFDEFFSKPDGPLSPDFSFTVENINRTHGIFYDFFQDVMYMTDIGDPADDTDGAIVIIPDFILAVIDINVSTDEQIRIEGGNTFLGNPVDIGYDPILEIIFVAERANNGGAILGFEVPEENGNYTPEYNSTFPGASAIDVPYIIEQGIDCDIVLGGTVELASGGTDTTIIVDGQPDLIVFSTDVMLNGFLFTYVVTDDQGVILGIPPGNTVDFDPAGTGTCRVYGLSYSGELLIEIGDDLLAPDIIISDDCFDLSSNNLTINRVADPCAVVLGGTVELQGGGTTTTIIIDGEPDLIQFNSLGATGGSFTYVITDSEGNILGIPTGDVVDFDPAGPGNCLVYGLSYTGSLNIMIGDNLFQTDLLSSECFDLSSNNLTIIRVPDPCDLVIGGTVEFVGGGTTRTIIIDGEPDVLSFSSDGASGGFFTYVITDSEGNILGIPPGNSVDFDPAGLGICLVYGLSYTGDLNIMVGDNLFQTDLISSGCFDFSSNNLTVNRIPDPCDMVMGGTVEFDGGGTTTTIIIDGEADVLEFTSDGATGGSFTYVVTDSEGNILGIPPGNSVDFDPAGTGTCFVYGLSYTGDLNIMVGDNLFQSDPISSECFDLSSNNLTVIRIPNPCDRVVGGTVEFDGGGTTTTIIIDGEADVLEFTSDGATGGSFTYVVTDSEGNILGIPPGNSVDFDPAGLGTCFVYGLSYTGDLNIMVGDNLFQSDLISSECFDLSSNNLTVIRIEPIDPCEEVAGGVVEFADGGVTRTIIIDGEADVLEFTSDGATGGSFTYVVTDSEGNILGIPPGNSVDFDPAGLGTCFVYGLSYTGDLNIMVGDNLFQSNPISSECFDLSSNNLTVIRIEEVAGGADLSIEITASDLVYDIFENTTFTIVVTNNGPNTATGVSVGAGLPSGFVYTSNMASQGEYILFTETWNVGTLAPDASATLELTLFSVVEGEEILMATEVSTSDQDDPDSTPGNGANGEDDYASLTLTPVIVTPTGADLSINIIADNLLYENYENTVFTITVTNNGPENATGITVAAPLPEGFVYTNDIVSQGEYELFFETWNVGNIAAGQTATLELELFSLIEGTDVTVTTEILTADQNDPDSTPGNGPNEEDDYDFLVLTPEDDGGIGTGEGRVDLELEVNVDQLINDENEDIDFIITITNNGPDVAENIGVSAGVPEGLAYTSDNPSMGDYDLWLERWTIPSLDAGATATLTLTLFATEEGTINYFTEVLFVNQNDGDSFPGNGNGVTPQEDDEAAVSVTVINMPNAVLNEAGSNLINITLTELYPNPTLEMLTLKMESLVEKEATIQIYNAMGAMIKSQLIFVNKNDNVFQIFVNNLPEGNYILRVPGTDILKRFIKVGRL